MTILFGKSVSSPYVVDTDHPFFMSLSTTALVRRSLHLLAHCRVAAAVLRDAIERYSM